eukprot:4454178-Pleurochrysis_carterae.AAC.1
MQKLPEDEEFAHGLLISSQFWLTFDRPTPSKSARGRAPMQRRRWHCCALAMQTGSAGLLRAHGPRGP